MPEKPAVDVSATSSTPLSGKEIWAAMDALIAEGQLLANLTQRQVWKKLGNRGSLETISKWFKRYPESKGIPGAPGEGTPEAEAAEGAAPTGGPAGAPEGGNPTAQGTDHRPAHDAEGVAQREADEAGTKTLPLNLPAVPGAVLALMQNNYVRDLTSLKESHHRERELLQQQTEDRVARARAEVRAEVVTDIARSRRTLALVAAGLCVVVGGIAAWSGFTVGRAEGGKDSLKVIGNWMEQERARSTVPVPTTQLPGKPEVVPEPAPVPKPEPKADASGTPSPTVDQVDGATHKAGDTGSPATDAAKPDAAAQSPTSNSSPSP